MLASRMRTLFIFVLSTIACVMAWADESWLGVYIQNAKIGYASYRTQPATLNGRTVTRSDAETVIKSKMLGSSLDMTVKSSTWQDEKGNVLRMSYDMASSGRTLKVTADVIGREIKAVMDTSGRSSQHTIQIPEGAVLRDDPTADYLNGNMPPAGHQATFYQFDAPSMALVKTTVTVKAKESIQIQGKSVDAIPVYVDDPRAAMTMYLSAKGDFLLGKGPMGMEMRPEPKEVALRIDGNTTISSDLASASAIRPNRPISNPFERPSLSILIKNFDASRMPTGGHQTVKRAGDAWALTIQPIRDPDRKTTIAAAAKQQAKWTKPDVRVPSDSTTFRNLATKLIGNEKAVVPAVERVRLYVLGLVRVNAGIGVMRDADEILETKEGVCRDHAILMAAILRAGGIPTKLVSGMVYADGAFYYHAWVEVWDGHRWYGVDSTRPWPYLTATHIKTAEGSVGDALSGFLMDGAKFEIMEKATSR